MKSEFPPTIELERLSLNQGSTQFQEDIRRGLSKSAKRIPPKYFYDERGSLLFEKICDLDEYYLTRAEHSILEQAAPDILAYSKGAMVLVELGSGSSLKTRLLIRQLLGEQGNLLYVPIDISASMLEESAMQLSQEMGPALEILALSGEYETCLERVAELHLEQKMILFLGSSIGNFELGQAGDFLTQIAATLSDQDYFLLGTDTRKDPELLEKAYNDRADLTARFNLNLLERLNRELGADFQVEQFAHKAIFNEELSRIEMHLCSLQEQTVSILALRQSFRFEKGECIHTESSYKYSTPMLQGLFHKSGLKLLYEWRDREDLFQVSLLARE